MVSRARLPIDFPPKMKLLIQARLLDGQLRLTITPTDRLAVTHNGIKTVLVIGQSMTFEASEIEIEDYEAGTIAKIKQLGEE
jgi:hypothetical protein